MADQNETAKMTMWRNAIAKEAATTRAHQQRWGFMCSHEKELDTQAHSKARIPTKYYDRNGATVVWKSLPVLPLDKEAAAQAQQPDVEQLISTQTFAPSAATRPMTATDSILYSHARRLHSIRSTDPFFKTTSQTYGNRMPLEQFGVSQHGHIQTAATRWDRRDEDLLTNYH